MIYETQVSELFLRSLVMILIVVDTLTSKSRQSQAHAEYLQTVE